MLFHDLRIAMPFYFTGGFSLSKFFRNYRNRAFAFLSFWLFIYLSSRDYIPFQTPRFRWYCWAANQMSIVSFAAFAVDKFLALAKLYRISEFVLVVLTLLGGWVGTGSAIYLFHHKTTKDGFSGKLKTILTVHGVVFILVCLRETYSSIMGNTWEMATKQKIHEDKGESILCKIIGREVCK